MKQFRKDFRYYTHPDGRKQLSNHPVLTVHAWSKNVSISVEDFGPMADRKWAHDCVLGVEEIEELIDFLEDFLEVKE